MWCTLIEAKPLGEDIEPFWIQLHCGQLNMQYLDEGDPSDVLAMALAMLPEGNDVVAWEPALYCTMDIDKLSDEQVGDLVEKLLLDYYNLKPDCEVVVSTQNLG